MANVQHPSQVLALFKPTGPVVGFHKTGSSNEGWTFAGVDWEPVTIRNSATGTYAIVTSESHDAHVVGNPEPYFWRVNFGYRGTFRITTVDHRFVWRLSGGEDGAPIVLQKTPYNGEDAEWSFGPNVQLVGQ